MLSIHPIVCPCKTVLSLATKRRTSLPSCLITISFGAFAAVSEALAWITSGYLMNHVPAKSNNKISRNNNNAQRSKKPGCREMISCTVSKRNDLFSISSFDLLLAVIVPFSCMFIIDGMLFFYLITQFQLIFYELIISA